MTTTTDGDRFLIVGTGRTGSSLLAAILHDAGANFGIGGREEWDRDSGAFEHPRLKDAYHWHAVYKNFTHLGLGPLKWVQRRLRSRVDQGIEDTFQEARFGKTTQLVQLVPHIHRLGYRPRIVVSYRRFAGYASSRHLRSGFDFEQLVDLYVRINGTAMLQLETFGGCAISYGEIQDPDEEGWAKALAGISRLDAADLLRARDERVEERRRRIPDLGVAPTVSDVFDALRQHMGEVVEGTK